MVSEHAAERLQITDGLRAVAVVAVVLFHFLPAQVTGGFIGVDVFFVISGFVIARAYLPSLAEGRIRMRDFFFRRIQRLVPAYLLVIVVVTLCAWLLLAPVPLLKFGQSLMSQAFYMQNVFFWIDGDYFEKAFQKPLLHTWSLAVEEQFYFLFPLLVLTFRWSRKVALVLLVIGLMGSLAAGLLAAGISPKTAFYLLPARVWEFFAGILVALFYGKVRYGRWATPVFVAGLAAVLVAVFAFDERAAFPGPQAILAVLGAAAICLVQAEISPLYASLLSNRVAQHLGRISYSWYLWHWPLVPFHYSVTDRSLTFLEGAVAILVSYLLAVATYRFVEQSALAWSRLRTGRWALGLLAVFLAFCLAAGLIIHATRGGLPRYGPEDQVLHEAQMDRMPYRCPWVERVRSMGSEVCSLVAGSGEPVLLIGDSHADHTKGILSVLAKEHGRPLYLTSRNCSPERFGKAGDACSTRIWRTLERDVKELGVTRIVAVSFSNATIDERAYRTGLEKLLSTGAVVYVQRVAPNGPYFNPGQRLEGKRFPPYDVAAYDRENAGQDAILRALQTEHADRLVILDPVPVLCAPVCAFDTEGKPNYMDNHHLNTVGMDRIIGIFEPVFGP